jgi:hypothetical protein
MVDFSQLKARSKNSIEIMNKKIDSESKGSFQKDTTYWTPTLDKAGNGSAVIRLLPVSPQDLALDEDAVPYIKMFRHGFKGPNGGWYIEDSLTTIGKSDPVSDANTKLWNKGGDDNKNIARTRKRKLNYVANIEVISDPAMPENEGKVFKYRFGKKIFDKIMAAKDGDPEAEIAGFDVFDFWDGANFRLKVKTILVDNKKMPNYDDSVFLPPKPHHGGDEKKLNIIWLQQYSLKELHDPKNFKTYEELQERLNKVIGTEEEPVVERPTAETVKIQPKTTPVTKEDVPFEVDTNTPNNLKYFQDLVDED